MEKYFPLKFCKSYYILMKMEWQRESKVRNINKEEPYKKIVF